MDTLEKAQELLKRSEKYIRKINSNADVLFHSPYAVFADKTIIDDTGQLLVEIKEFLGD